MPDHCSDRAFCIFSKLDSRPFHGEAGFSVCDERQLSCSHFDHKSATVLAARRSMNELTTGSPLFAFPSRFEEAIAAQQRTVETITLAVILAFLQAGYVDHVLLSSVVAAGEGALFSPPAS